MSENIELNWRLLRADEIEVREGNKNKDKTRKTLLLYKDARCDMARLDEQFTQYGWQRDHKDIHGVSYCGVSLRDPKTGEWVTKWDAGANDNEGSMGQKGEASDSFKRACVNWGIGRELYTAPQMWVDAKIPTYSLKVSFIAYNKEREIVGITIQDDKGVVIFKKTAPQVRTYEDLNEFELDEFDSAKTSADFAENVLTLYNIYDYYKEARFADLLKAHCAKVKQTKGW